LKLFTFLCIFLIGCSRLPSKRTDKLSILQGITNTKEVEFSIVAKKERALKFQLRDESGTIINPEETKIVTRGFSDYGVHKAIFSRDHTKIYNLYVFENEKIVDQRLVGRGQREESKLKIAVVSCLSDFYSKHFKIWDTLVSKNPEYLLMIGDNVYADQTTANSYAQTNPEIIWERYVDARLRFPVYFQQKLIPTHGLWDDHDYGLNNGNRDFKYKDDAKEIFEAFFAQDLSNDDWSKSTGVGGLLSLGDFNLYFLDGRSFRTEEKSGSHLGLDQSAWLYSKLREEVTPSLVIKGDQFFGGYHSYESFEGNHPENFQDFVAELKQMKTPFVFISGDRHLSEIMQFPRSLFGKPSFEITSSPMHAKTFSEEVDNNPWRVVSEKAKVNFTIIENEAKDNHWFLDVENIGENAEIHFRRELAVYIKDLQDNLKETRKRRYGKRRYRRLRRR